MSDQQRAATAVAKAVKNGSLPKLDGTINCIECGAAASEYDHRDYRKPLDVQPVCHACNVNLGSAIGHIPDRRFIRIQIGQQRVRISRDVHIAAKWLQDHLRLATSEEAYRLAISAGLHYLGVKI